MEDAGAGAPLGVRRAELRTEEPGEGPLADAHPAGEPGQGPGAAQVLLDRPARLGQARVLGGGERQGLDVRAAQPVVEHGPQPPQFGFGQVRFGAGDEEFAQQAVHGQDRRRAVGQRGVVRREAEGVDHARPVDPVLVPHLRRGPHGAVAGDHPGPALGLDGRDPGADVQELVVVVPMAADDLAGGVDMGARGRDRREARRVAVAVLRHK